MCNIAGYVGERQAAPILIEMIRAQEGFLGGYFTGIATIDNGRIHYAKLTGDVDHLTALTEAARLPGKIGIIHSRSNAGGGDEWAHPFLGWRNGEAVTAYVANGAAGYFLPRMQEFCEIADRLHAKGYTLDSRVAVESERYPKMADGLGVHMSDVMCQLILQKRDDGIEYPRAMAEAFVEMPSEIVGLLLSLEKPDHISFARINMPMFVAFCTHGAYLSSTPIAIPDDANEPQLLPLQSFGEVTSTGFWVKKMPKVANIAPIAADVVARGYEGIRAALHEGERGVGELVRDVLKPLFEEADCRPGAALCYQILHAMLRNGEIGVKTVRVPGAREGLDAPESHFYQKA